MPLYEATSDKIPERLYAAFLMDCLFGLFDILGYKNFCENCNSTEATPVFQSIDDLGTELPKICSRHFGAASTQIEKHLLANLYWLTFSDTIFVAMPLDLKLTEKALHSRSILFLMVCSFINRQMFENGFPVRGCVHKGNILVGKRGYGGKAIVDAYEIPKNVAVAASIISDETKEFIAKCYAPSDPLSALIHDLIVQCELPTKTGDIRMFDTLNWISLGGQSSKLIFDLNLRDFILEQFQAHGKQLNEKAKIIAINTERLFKHWIERLTDKEPERDTP